MPLAAAAWVWAWAWAWADISSMQQVAEATTLPWVAMAEVARGRM